MAKKPIVYEVTDDEQSLDELLGPDDDQAIELPTGEKLKMEDGEITTKKIKEPKAPREIKGQLVRFKNKKGEEITGMGVLYYVVRFEGKLHYKEASQVKEVQPAEQPDLDIPPPNKEA